MSRIVISNSSANNLKAVAIKRWLGSHADYGWGPDEIFLDIEGGINPGQRWQEALRQGVDRCEAVICLISPAWLASRYCFVEFKDAQRYKKPIFGVIIEPVKFADIPNEMTAEWQLCDLTMVGGTEAFDVEAKAETATIGFPKAGLASLLDGIKKSGLTPGGFRLEAGRPPYPGLKPLEEAGDAIFFGRDSEFLRALDRIRGMRITGPEQVMIVLGASGAGKSPFLRAGLLRRLYRDDRNFFPLAPLRPLEKAISGENGLATGLMRGFANLHEPRSRGEIVAKLSTDSDALANYIIELRQLATARLSNPGKPVSIVISIDQAEELRNERGTAKRHREHFTVACRRVSASRRPLLQLPARSRSCSTTHYESERPTATPAPLCVKNGITVAFSPTSSVAPNPSVMHWRPAGHAAGFHRRRAGSLLAEAHYVGEDFGVGQHRKQQQQEHFVERINHFSSLTTIWQVIESYRKTVTSPRDSKSAAASGIAVLHYST